jgi:hypothetical protein
VPTFTVPKTGLAKGPGTLFYADPGTAFPTYTVVGSVWSDNTWASWTQWGITKGGSEWTIDVSQDPIQAAEYIDDIDQVTTGRVVSVKFEIMNITAALMVRALNRPTPATTGSGTTKRTTVKMPGLGAEQFSMMGWQSTDDTERIIGPNCLQIGSMTINRKKGADVGTMTLEMKLFPDATGEPYYHDFAGAVRA